MKRPLSLLLSVAAASVLLSFPCPVASAENIRDVESSDNFVFNPSAGTCDVFTYERGDLRLESSASFFSSFSPGLIFATTLLTAAVDPASGGPDYFELAPVSLESGKFSMRGRSVDLAFENELLFLGQVRSVDRRPSFASLLFQIELTYVNPLFIDLLGPIRTLTYETSNEVWFSERPWIDPVPAQSDCSPVNRPILRFYSEALAQPNPVTIQMKVPADAVSTQCPFIESQGETIEVQFTYDSNTRDLDPDPNIGRYLSCDDAYGAVSGTIVRAGEFFHRRSCVLIEVENDSTNGSPGSTSSDLYTVSLIGPDALTGTVVRLEDPSGASFADDSLPDRPVLVAPSTGMPGFVTFGSEPVLLELENACSIASSVLSPVFEQLNDMDADGLVGAQDNCLEVANRRQRDSDGDGFGNACDPDFNNDGVVNKVDLGIMKRDFFTRGNSNTDLDSDGSVSAADLGRLKTLFFQSPGPSGLVP
ncbi:MAG: thrombospondin type 3 repeat-containing protein [Gammaproteobacteria bacterium]